MKIGVAKRPDRRLAFLQPANPCPLTIRAVGRGGRLAENALHRRFAKDRITDSEWFEPSPALREFMAALPSWEAVAAGAKCPEIDATDRHRTALARLWERGYSYEDIGGLIDVTRQRAHQIISPLVDHSISRPECPSEPIEAAFERVLGEIA